MARYYLLEINTSPSTLNTIQSASDFGREINFLFENSKDLDLPSLGGRCEIPAPVALVIERQIVGHYVGRHYDGEMTGITTVAPIIIPGHMVFTFLDSHMDQLNAVTGQEFVAVLSSFYKDPDNYEMNLLEDGSVSDGVMRALNVLKPVWLNDLPTPALLYIMKTKTFDPQDQGKVVRDPGGIPWFMPEDYISPRRASNLDNSHMGIKTGIIRQAPEPS
jgi:hypothetical protein